MYNLEIYPELRLMVGAEATAQAFACKSGVMEDEEDALRVLFRAFVTANPDVVATQVKLDVNCHTRIQHYFLFFFIRCTGHRPLYPLEEVAHTAFVCSGSLF